jgi:diphthamide synthase (EF-2-diphthine--ammonia ligase)
MLLCGVTAPCGRSKRHKLELPTTLADFPIVLVPKSFLTSRHSRLTPGSPTIVNLRKTREQNGLDLCGEEGEYHTLVTDGMRFEHRIAVRSASKRITDSLAYWQIDEMELRP